MNCGCGTPTNCTCRHQEPACNCPPSPEPPWARAVQSPQTQLLGGAGVVSLTVDVTYLSQTAINPQDQSGNGPYAVTLPNGNYKRQYKRIFVVAGNAATTATFTVTGTFVGFTSLTFNTLAWSAMLEWDGAGWQWIGGNAVINP